MEKDQTTVDQTTVDTVLILIENCKTIAMGGIGEAMNLISKGNPIVKIPDLNYNDILIQRKNNCGFLVDIITNFRTNDGNPIGNLKTKMGTIPIPQFWPTNIPIHSKYGHPTVADDTNAIIVVDGYLVSTSLNNLIINNITFLPQFPFYGGF